MKKLSLIRQLTLGILLAGLGIFSSCNAFQEDLPECRLYVKFKYDYNMEFADAFHSQVNKVELFVFDESGKFLFSQIGEGAPLATGNYRMEVGLPVGNYKMMAWAGAGDSYDITELTPGVSTIEELQLKLKRDASLIHNDALETLWYGEIIDVHYDAKSIQTETINLIRDTKKVRFVFQGISEDPSWTLDADDYTFEIIESNGYLGYDNALLTDDVISYRPYFEDQKSPSAVVVELNTMRLMADRATRFVVKEKATGVTKFSINLIDYLLMTEMEGYNFATEQEYLDRKSEYSIVFFFEDSLWMAVKIIINGWEWRIQHE